MNTDTDKCTVCGCTELNLIDGFYYCVECNTQNTYVRETIVEQKTLGDGTFALSSKKRIVKLPKKTIQMSGEWYKWHAFNFIINGLADELVALGAKPTFKTKLLWIWSRYVKKYLNKKEFGVTGQSLDNNMMDKPEDEEEDDFSEMNQEEEEGVSKKKSRWKNTRKINNIADGSKRDIKFLSKGVIMAMMYLALNLDKSEIQLSHLERYAREKRLNFIKLVRFVPEEINLKAVPLWQAFAKCHLSTPYAVRVLCLSLLRKLDLGTPILPDLKKIVNDYFKELCLPKDLKPLVHSLMHFGFCESLDLDDKGKEYLLRLPDYECIVMSYILLALKLCFGMDGDYEVRLSDAVDKINEDKDLPKSHKFGKYSNTTDRLFSFREWCSYMQFRKIMLCKYCLYMAEQHYLDIDDHVHMEHMADRPQSKRQLIDDISMDLLNKIQLDNNVGVIPKEEFVPTSRPLSLYTEIITDHCQDPDLKYLLSEDFTQYSLKYATENLELHDVNTSYNLIKGVTESNKIINTQVILGSITKKKSDKHYVYVKNCENRNWMKTNPPTLQHITSENQNADSDERNEKDSDHGYDSENTVNDKDVTNTTEVENTQDIAVEIQEINFTNVVTDNTVLQESGDQEMDESEKLIKEEDEEKNIFDDSFEYLDIEGEIQPAENDAENEQNDEQPQNAPNEIDFDDNESDISCTSFHNFNPATFDRLKTIKELVLHACKKYNIVVPKEYKKDKKPMKRKLKTDVIENGESKAKRPNKADREQAKKQVDDLLNNYKSHIEGDFFGRLQQEVKDAIDNANEAANIENNAEETNLIERTCDEQNATDTHMDNQSNNDVNGNESETDEETRKERDETIEMALFEGEEMILDDLIPKTDPKFDERNYDVKQLYINLKVEAPEDVMEYPPELEEIVSRKIMEAKEGHVFDNSRQDIDQSDSEDDIPLSLIKEEKDLVMRKEEHKEDFEALIKNENIPEFKYWFRHYESEFMEKSRDWNKKFDEELKENTPASFFFVIKECASVINCSAFHLYKNLQLLEQKIIIASK